MIMRDATKIFKRHPGGPLLKVQDYPGTAQIYNPSPVRVGDETILLVSVVEHAATHGYGRDVGQTRVARSKDGIHFELGTENFIDCQAGVKKPYISSTGDACNNREAAGPERPSMRGEPWDRYHHFIDNRVTKIEDWYYIITPVMVKGYDSPIGMLGRTKDFTTYERIDTITQPKNRGASLFPEKIHGKYYKLDRPGGGDGSGGDIWISASPDLIHWGEFKPVLAAGYRFWNTQKIGPTPPIKTEQGWLDIIHGVFCPAGGTYYYIGAMLLDLDEPWKVIGKTNSYLMMPEEPWERHGNCDNTIFPCGAIADYEQDRIRLYYGACDHSICLAIGSLNDTVRACLQGL